MFPGYFKLFQIQSILWFVAQPQLFHVRFLFPYLSVVFILQVQAHSHNGDAQTNGHHHVQNDHGGLTLDVERSRYPIDGTNVRRQSSITRYPTYKTSQKFVEDFVEKTVCINHTVRCKPFNFLVVHYQFTAENFGLAFGQIREEFAYQMSAVVVPLHHVYNGKAGRTTTKLDPPRHTVEVGLFDQFYQFTESV